MLDRMRRHRAWLKWSLGIVVLTFILLYIPSFLKQDGVGAAPTDTLATVDGRAIKVGTYQRAYQTQINRLRGAYGDQLNDQMLKQLGISQRLVQQLIEEEAMLAEAGRLGIKVSDAELKERILRMPEFQEGGQFVGNARYTAMLRMARPPITPVEFEDQIRRSLTIEKLQHALTGWVRVSDADVDQEYARRNEKVKLDLAVFTANQFRAGIQPTDAEIQARFNANPEAYRLPEKRRVRYLSIDAEALRAKMTATPQEVEARYQQNLATYQTPEQVRASHILFKTEGKDEAAVKKVAETVLAKAKAGEDFAKLAKQYSEDGSKDQGGDLDYFGRGAMVKEFEDVAFSQAPGQISGLVKSQFGFHIIKTVDKRAAATRTLAEVKPQLEDQIKFEKAQAEASKVADEVAKDIDDPSDLDRVAAARSLTVGDSGLFARDEPLAGLGFAPTVSAEAFRMDQGKVSGVLRTNQGYAWITLVEVKQSALPKLDEVKDKVSADVVRTKAVDLARAKAETMAQAAKTNFAAAAKAAGVEVKSTELITRGTAIPEVGTNKAVDDAVFALKVNETTGPIATDNAVVVARVKERQDAKPEELAKSRPSLRAELMNQRGNEFFGAYMTKARDRFTVKYNENALKLLFGGQ
jgi:peptidyl-prolyl cis-trans isomerase D